MIWFCVKSNWACYWANAYALYLSCLEWLHRRNKKLAYLYLHSTIGIGGISMNWNSSSGAQWHQRPKQKQHCHQQMYRSVVDQVVLGDQQAGSSWHQWVRRTDLKVWPRGPDHCSGIKRALAANRANLRQTDRLTTTSPVASARHPSVYKPWSLQSSSLSALRIYCDPRHAHFVHTQNSRVSWILYFPWHTAGLTGIVPAALDYKPRETAQFSPDLPARVLNILFSHKVSLRIKVNFI